MVFLMFLLLCGCTGISDEKLTEQLDRATSSFSDISAVSYNNFISNLDYYLPSDMSDDYDGNFLVFHYHDTDIYANINVSAVVEYSYSGIPLFQDDGFFDSSFLFYSKKMQTIDNKNEPLTLQGDIYRYEDSYAIHLFSRSMNYYCLCEKGEVLDLLQHMILLCRCSKVNEEEIVSLYSRKDVIDYTKKQIELFESYIPIDGTLSNLLIGSDGNFPIDEQQQTVDDTDEDNNDIIEEE